MFKNKIEKKMLNNTLCHHFTGLWNPVENWYILWHKLFYSNCRSQDTWVRFKQIFSSDIHWYRSMGEPNFTVFVFQKGKTAIRFWKISDRKNFLLPVRSEFESAYSNL